MRDDWKRVPLGDVLRPIQREVSVTDLVEVPFAGVRLYAEGVYPRAVQPAGTVKTKKLNRILEGDIVYNRMWATKASFGVVRDDAAGCLVTNDFPIFGAVEGEVLGDYVGLLFEWGPFQQDAAAAATGTTERRRLNQQDFVKIAVPLPPLVEQRRIVDLIAALDDTIAAAEVLLDGSQSLVAALSSLISSGCEQVELRTLGQLVTGATPATKNEVFWNSQDVPFLTPGDLGYHGASVDPAAAERWVSQEAADKSTRLLTGTGVLQVCIGATVGKVGVVHGPALFNQQINALLGLDDDDARVLAAILASEAMQGVIKRRAGSSTMPLVSKSAWAELRIGWPEKAARAQWAHLLNSLDGSVEAASSQVSRLRVVRTNLLTGLLSGVHEIPSSYDDLLVGVAA